jgi:hypothetical protein
MHLLSIPFILCTRARHTGPVNVEFDLDDHVPTRSGGMASCADARPAESSRVGTNERIIAASW